MPLASHLRKYYVDFFPLAVLGFPYLNLETFSPFPQRKYTPQKISEQEKILPFRRGCFPSAWVIFYTPHNILSYLKISLKNQFPSLSSQLPKSKYQKQRSLFVHRYFFNVPILGLTAVLSFFLYFFII
jgi:hypothetical protein